MSAENFTEEQKQYLQGFAAGAGLAQASKPVSLNVLPTFAQPLGTAGAPAAPAGNAEPTPAGPEAVHRLAQDRFLADGKKLTNEDQAKRKAFPLDLWDMVVQHARDGKYPKGTDVFLFKFQGLFYVAPAQDSFMCRLRFAGGIVSSHQARGMARLAEQYAGGYTDLTTRANLQFREIGPKNTVDLLTGLHDLGIINRGAGADNIRNVTGSPTAGIDPQELIDTRPLAREMHHYILNHREMYALPRKFNIAFDGGGAISALDDTNDIGFTAVRVAEGKQVPADVYYRLTLGGITGHKDFARDTGVMLKPEECVPVAAAIVRVFTDHGDRTDRKKARLKYVLDRFGFEKYLEETQKHLGFPLRRFALENCEPRPAVAKHGHVGVHPQKQEGLFYVGVVLPVGRMTSAQLTGLANISERYGSGTLRLTVWQNLLISDVAAENVDAVKGEIEALGLGWSAASVRAGLIACTGNAGCKFANTNTKANGLAIADYLESRLPLDQPVNIHLTGCPNSCAQHYIGDIGLLGTKVSAGDDMLEGYHVFVGGGYGAERDIGREIYRNVLAAEAPAVIEKMLRGYLENRKAADETFRDFLKRHPAEELKRLFDPQAVPA